jgi:hypothetical protein
MSDLVSAVVCPPPEIEPISLLKPKMTPPPVLRGGARRTCVHFAVPGARSALQRRPKGELRSPHNWQLGLQDAMALPPEIWGVADPGVADPSLTHSECQSPVQGVAYLVSRPVPELIPT